ncbi:MAG: hypothetical protein KDB53_17370, partial [Planctomycetes bacterium]|nr:hypothetical protein [Planctomycetota bacterium]
MSRRLERLPAGAFWPGTAEERDVRSLDGDGTVGRLRLGLRELRSGEVGTGADRVVGTRRVDGCGVGWGRVGFVCGRTLGVRRVGFAGCGRELGTRGVGAACGRRVGAV